MSKIRKSLLAVFVILAMFCAMFSVTALANGTLILENASSLEGFKYGQIIPLPEGTLKFGDESKSAAVTVVYPDGRKTSESTLELNVEGVYTVEYKANFSVGEQSTTDTFTVKKDLYMVSSDASTVEYDTYKYAEHTTETAPDPESFVDKDGSRAKIKAHFDSLYASETTGLKVALGNGDTFTYSKVVDLSKLTKDDNLISIVVTPEKMGVKDVEDFSVILTDAYDPTNYITINLKATAGDKVNSISYLRAAASNGQQLTGFEWNRNGKKHVNDSYGMATRMNLSGFSNYSGTYYIDDENPIGVNSDVKLQLSSIEKNKLSINFDYSELAIYNPASTHSSSNALLVDFDDPTHFEKTWSGFTTGECFISIRGGSYVSNNFNFVITEIHNQDLTSNEFEGRGTLDIKVAMDGYTESTLPEALVGRAYPIFSATCVNQYFGNLPVTFSVKDSLGNDVPVVDGTFTPAAEGSYEIIYTVKDFLGNTNDKRIPITATTALSELTLSCGEKQTDGIAGIYVPLADVDAYGGSGNKTISYQVTCDENTIEIKDGQFFPTKGGVYTVTVIAVDYIGQTATYTYEVSVVDGDKPVYIEKPVLPKYFVSGKSYELPKVVAYDYTDGSGSAVATKIAYIDGEGTKNAIGTTVTPVVNEIRNTVTIIYYTQSATAEGNLIFENIPVSTAWDNNGIDVTKLFWGDEMNVRATNTYAVLSTDSENGYTDFVNALDVNGLSVTFKGIEGYTNYEHFTITVTDSQNIDRQIKLIYSPFNEDKSHFRINDVTAVPYEAGQSLLSSDDTFTVKIDSTDWSVTYDRNSNSSVEIKTYLNGKDFEGFSDLVYVTFGIEGSNGTSEVRVSDINGTTLSKRTTDQRNPRISIIGSYLGFKNYGAEVRIPKAVVTDVLDPYAVGCVTVETPENADGKRAIVMSVDGVYLNAVSVDRDYYIKVDQYGSYLVTFMAVDGSGNEYSFQYFVTVVDREAPEIKLSGTVKTTGSVGKKITVPTATAMDAVDGKTSVIVYVQTPSGMMYAFEDGKYAFTPDRAGVYRIMYVSYDASGNTGSYVVEIVVS